MGVLVNPDHERFCQEVHRRILAREARGQARTAAYREHIYRATTAPPATDDQLAANARRLAGQKQIRERLAELADFAAKLAGIDASWAMVELKSLLADVRGFNLDDYLGPPDEDGNRYYDLSKVPRDTLGRLTEYSIESSTVFVGEGEDKEPREIRKVRLKGPSKTPEAVAILALMARIQGWEAPKKIAPTNAAGDGPAEVNLNTTDEDRTRALQAFIARTAIKGNAT